MAEDERPGKRSRRQTDPYWQEFKFFMPDKFSNGETFDGHPIVDTVRVDDLWWKVVHYPFSIEHAIKVLRSLNRLPFLPGEAGKLGAFIRVVGDPGETGAGSDFVVAGKTVYPCAPMCDPNSKLLMESTRAVYTAILSTLRDLNLNLFIPNTLYANVVQILANDLSKSNY